ncbi:hypothetical protein [Edaphobacter modestus]|uniref:hypothetical protein n=1 Tax=Edaphobacter modestus TaxID=388466 RepID=UPI00102ACD61|nr:hypothetical protein [Edaphobacter modestus]
MRLLYAPVLDLFPSTWSLPTAMAIPSPTCPQTDFTIRESKIDQRINSFDEHSGSSTTPPHVPASGTFTNAITVRGASANVLLLDWLNTPPRDQQYMRDQLVKFVNAEQPGTQTAIFALGASLHLLQDFTTDPVLLKAAVLKQGVKFSPLLREESGKTDSMVQAYENMIEASTNPAITAMLAGLQSPVVTANFREQSGQDRIRIQVSCWR